MKKANKKKRTTLTIEIKNCSSAKIAFFKNTAIVYLKK